MACFGHHGHSGHDHSHGHGHSHAHSHSPKNGYDGQSSHDHNSPTSPALSLLETSPATISKHSHSHENENMKGIFLHVLADTMGSAAVIVSTLLIQFIGWTGWDPIASAFIAVLIFVSSIPLVRSSAKKLLLTVPADTEYQLRNTLAGISNLRGVAAYSVPRFWMADKGCELEADNVLGVMHVIAMKGSNIEEVRESVRAFLSSQGMDVVVQVDREGHGKCWCGGDNIRSPSASRYS
jgi:solute carrier family 30 (zinc transporter), member 5/7